MKTQSARNIIVELCKRQWAIVDRIDVLVEYACQQDTSEADLRLTLETLEELVKITSRRMFK